MKRLMRLWYDFNDWLGTKLAIFLSSMGCFWIIFAMTVVPIFSKSHPVGFIEWIQYLVQCIFQGAALPIVGYVSDKGSKMLEKMINEIHDAIINRLDKQVDEIKEKVTEELRLDQKEDDEVKEILRLLEEISKKLDER